MNRLRVLAALGLGGALSAGCNPSHVCGTRSQDVTGADGGTALCQRAEDCPLPSTVQVCTSAPPGPYDNCVSCLDSRCVQQTQEYCP